MTPPAAFSERFKAGDCSAPAARLVYRGKSIGLVECDVLNGDGKLVAHAVSTFSVLGGEKALGR